MLCLNAAVLQHTVGLTNKEMNRGKYKMQKKKIEKMNEQKKKKRKKKTAEAAWARAR